MFGYVRPLKSELKMRQWDMYKSLYCGLCHALKERCGFAARFTVNYDFTFLALVMSAISEEKFCAQEKRCIASPAKKRKICASNSALDFSADTSVILTYWKLKDEIRDLKFISSVPARIAALLLKGAYQRAQIKHPEFSKCVKDCLGELSEMEKNMLASIDAPADTFARILKSLADEIEDEKKRRIISQMLYHIGRYIYLTDALDDLEEDIKACRYNPIAARFNITEMPLNAEIAEQIKETIAQSIKASATAFELIDAGEYDGLIRNILTLGLPSVVLAVEKGQLNKKEKVI